MGIWYVIQPAFHCKLALMSTLSTVAIYSHAEGASVSACNNITLLNDSRLLPQQQKTKKYRLVSISPMLNLLWLASYYLLWVTYWRYKNLPQWCYKRVERLADFKHKPDHFKIWLEVVLIAVSLAIKRACNLMAFSPRSRGIMHSGQLFSWCKPSAL